MSSACEQVSHGVTTPFTYSSLPLVPNTTRMIRLLPNSDKSAPIQCELFNYNISRLGEEHLYEALSYAWGSPDRSRSIILNGCRFLITESLHTALLHLRNRQLDRILCVDAISIKQDNDNGNDNEKSKQIPLMPMIYAQARRVVVWLGEAQDYGDKALEVLGNLGRKQKSMPIEENDREKCEKLLQRDWFRRIWVLQEVGLAQHVTIMCGSLQINGQVFCEGLENLEPSPALMARISPVSFLIRGASFRSYDEHHSTATLSIGELVSMYRNHKATVQHDKIYALLGLSADGAALIPNYQLAWHEVFKQLVEHVFPKCSVETWCGCDLAVIKGKGRVLGYIYSISDFMEGSQQTFRVIYNQPCQQLGYQNTWDTKWSLQASGELIQDGDIVCLLEGLSEPSILRLCADYYVLVTPVAKPNNRVQDVEDEVVVGESHSTHSLCDIVLVWKVSQYEDEADLQSLSNFIEIVPRGHEEQFESERRLNHTTSTMVDAAMEITVLGISGKRALENILFQGRIKELDAEYLIQKRKGVPRDFEFAVKQALWQPSNLFEVWKEVLEVSAREPEPCGKGILMIIIQRLAEKLPVPEEVVKTLADSSTGHGYEIMQLLLEHCGNKLPVSEEVVKAAAVNTCQGYQIMQLLLKHCGDKLPVSEEMVKAATANSRRGYQIMQLLFKHRGDKLPVSEEMVKTLADSNTEPKYQIMQLLLEHCGNKLPVSEEVVKAAAANGGRGDQIMQQLLEYYGDKLPVSEEVVNVAAANSQRGDQIMQLLLKHHGDKLPVSEEMAKAAAVNSYQGYQIMQLLLKHCGDKLPVSEEVVKAATAYGRQGYQIMQLLLEYYGDKLPVSEGVVKAAAANGGRGYRGYQIMQLLLKHRGDKLSVTEEVVKTLADSSTGHGYEILQLLLTHRGDKLPISEGVVKAAAANGGRGYRGYQIMQLLLEHRGDKLPVTEEVVKILADSNGIGHGYDILQLLLKHHGDKLPVSEEVVKILADSSAEYGYEILQQLLKYHGNKLPVSEEVVKVAAANSERGDQIMQLLFEHRGDKLPVSEEVVKAAAANVYQGNQIIQLLLKHRGTGYIEI